MLNKPENLNEMRALNALLLLLLLQGGLSSSIAAVEESPQQDNTRKVRSCKGLWRPDELLGRCFGLTEYEKVKGLSAELKGKKIGTADDCRKLCCALGDRCITWQWASISEKCTVGPVVRLGFEGCDSKVGGDHCGNWCEPHATAKWNGKRVKSRDPSTGECTWGEELPSQCFGFGPEQFKDDKKKEKYSTDECAMACCKDKSCNAWQEIPGRGCFYGQSDQCPQSDQFTGGRKCIKGHCGGMEKEILEPWLARYAANDKS